MSILLGTEILEEYNKGKIEIEPFNELFVGPNSIDVTLSNKLLTYVPCFIKKINNINYVQKLEFPTSPDNLNGWFIDMAKENKTYELNIPEDGLVLLPDILYLGATNERAGSDYYVPMYEGRSSMARLGIQSHISAGFGDLFFKSNWTLEITVVHPTKVYANRRIGQVYFHNIHEDVRNKLVANGREYKGKYVNQPYPQASKSYLDFDN